MIEDKQEIVEKLFHAKLKYGQLFLFKINKKRYICRPLAISEIKAISDLSKLVNEVFIEDWILKTTYVFGDDSLEYILTKEKCFIAKTLVSSIVKKSNIDSEELFVDLLEKERKTTSTIQGTLEIFIQKAFPTANLHLSNSLTNFQQIQCIAKSESLLGTPLNIGKSKTRDKLKKYRFAEGATVLGPDDITSPEVADKPEW